MWADNGGRSGQSKFVQPGWLTSEFLRAEVSCVSWWWWMWVQSAAWLPGWLIWELWQNLVVDDGRVTHMSRWGGSGWKEVQGGTRRTGTIGDKPKGESWEASIWSQLSYFFFINGRDLNWMCQVNIDFENMYIEANCKKPFQYFK